MGSPDGPLIVQKYGGTSVATPALIQSVARRIRVSRESGARLVVVVSAMGKSTDRMLDMAREVTNNQSVVDPREVDTLLSAGELISSSLLALALASLGVTAVSLSAYQAGIRTFGTHRQARIAEINAERIQRELDDGKVVVVTGFQGVAGDGDVTTLGRGGSDTSAVALAVELKAERCEIYTDVEGIYTADPRICPKATKLSYISYTEMLELASLGVKMNPRSIELATVYKVPLYIGSSFSNVRGTVINGDGMGIEDRKVVTGIGVDMGIAKVTLTGVEDRPGVSAGLVAPLASRGLNVSAIVQNTSAEGDKTDLTLAVKEEELDLVVDALKTLDELSYGSMVIGKNLARVGIVGTGVTNSLEYAGTMFSTLAKVNVNIDMISTSDVSVTCVITVDDVERAVNALHDAFELERAS